MPENQLPSWWDQLIKQHQQGVGRVFVLHNNVNDLVYYPDLRPAGEADIYRQRPHPFREMLMRLLAREGGFGPIFYYSPTKPLTLFYLEGEQFKVNREVYVDPGKLGQALTRLPAAPGADASPFGEEWVKQIQISSSSPQDRRDLLYQFEPLLEQTSPEYLRLVLILDFFEKITTQHERGSQYEAEEIIRRWALSDALKQSQNLVLGLTIEQGDLPSLLRRPESLIRFIKIPLPEQEERRQFLDYWALPRGPDESLGPVNIDALGDEKEAPDPDPMATEEKASKAEKIRQAKRRETLSALTKGFRLLNLETMVRMSKAGNSEGKIDLELWKQQKAEVIKEESDDLLEEISDKRGFEAVGGLQYAREYLAKIARALREGAKDKSKARSVPKGILLVGPPGTGKSILAEALAKESGTTMVKLGDVQASLVGESEKRMSKALQLLNKLAPVVVFVDEIDQIFGTRSSGAEGDSGVNRRLFGKLLAFMGNNDYRAKVLWIGASNRPDLLDPAHLSRFDTVMAILPPYAVEERHKILEVLEHNIPGIEYSDDLKNRLRGIAAQFYGLSGRDLETIVRKAADEASYQALRISATGSEKVLIEYQDLEQAYTLYKPNADQQKLDDWTIRALMAVNFLDMIPCDLEIYPSHLRPFVTEAIKTKSNLPLDNCLEKIQSREFYKQQREHQHAGEGENPAPGVATCQSGSGASDGDG